MEMEDIMSRLNDYDEQIKITQAYITETREKLQACEEHVEWLKEQRKIAEEEENKIVVDDWFNKYGILNQKEAREKSIFIVFDKFGNYIRTARVGLEEEFRYVGPVEYQGTLEYWLRENKLYAHNASSFCDRDIKWYTMSLLEQLKMLSWDVNAQGQLTKTQW